MKTRFAPSPTGYLHLGGARTALYSWLLAKKHQGKFVLRIEDTDRERSTQAAVDAIMEGMAWLRLTYDEGPFFQTARMARYHEVLQNLLDKKLAYRCICSIERLETLRETQLKNSEKPRYDGHCREKNIGTDAPFVIRFKNPDSGAVVFDDKVRGTICIQNAELDDLILARSDSTPTYNFCVVIDDWDMQITHVVRGDDHISNTPRQINLLKALHAPIPEYAHLPMILGSDGTRLSKRHGAVSVTSYRDEGYLPEAMLNYLVRLGWSHGDQEIFSLEEMISYFDLKQVNKAPAAFNLEKLQWFNQQYLKKLSGDELAKRLMPFIDYETAHKTPMALVAASLVERAKTLKELSEKMKPFYIAPAVNKELIQSVLSDKVVALLPALKNTLSIVGNWDKEILHALLNNFLKENGLKMPELGKPLRAILLGTLESPSLDLTLFLLGKNECIARLSQ
jgi:glutamyl-tRNA synthetase